MGRLWVKPIRRCPKLAVRKSGRGVTPSVDCAAIFAGDRTRKLNAHFAEGPTEPSSRHRTSSHHMWMRSDTQYSIFLLRSFYMSG
jgi:hypothetical protein